MNYQALLLNNNYELIALISERKSIKLLLKECKVEVLSSWDDTFHYMENYIKYPAVLKMVYQVRRPNRSVVFSRHAIIKRDSYTCQYCSRAMTEMKDITIDHIIPKVAGGNKSWLNSVTCCQPCNSRKGCRTLEQSGMKLISKPFVPNINSVKIIGSQEIKHPDWAFYANK